MRIDESITLIIRNLSGAFCYDQGKFYGSAAGLSLGIGIICVRAPYVLYNPETKRMGAVRGLALILTHECDLANNRFACEDLLICPIVPIEMLLVGFQNTDTDLPNFVDALAKDRVSRLFYLPPLGTHLQNGGVLPLNQITTTRIVWFKGRTEPVAALSEYAAYRVDLKLKNHLFRSKADRLPVLH